MITGLPRAFVLLWAAQLVSNLGTQVSLYALGLWLYQRQAQLATFATVAIAVQLAKLLVLPLLGRRLALWPRRRVMMIANGIGSGCTLLLALQLLRFGGSTPVVLGCIAVAAAAEATLLLCFSSLIPQLVPREQLGAASGLFASADGAIVMAAPFLGALLAASGGLVGVLVVDAASSLLAAACTAVVALPVGRAPVVTGEPEPQLLSSGVRAAIAELWGRPQWRPLLLINTLVAGALAAVEIAFPAWVVSAFGVGRLSLAMALGGLGYLLGSQLWARRWAGAPAVGWAVLLRRALLLQGVLLTGSGLVLFQAPAGPLAVLWFASVASFALAVPLVLAALQALWQQQIPAALQPRLFAGRYSLEALARLAALLGISLLADRLVAPAVAWSHWPAWFIGALGTGPGRATAMALGLLGWAVIVPLLAQWRPLGRMARSAA
ncbi:MAG: MFS transporter [Cyanobacteriota bacterium]|nr:MFS transporter [Cyanobacteriota bacterium]